MPRGPSGSSQDSRRGGSSSRADAEDMPWPYRATASQRAGQFGGEVGQGRSARGLPAISSEQSSSGAGRSAEQGSEEAGQGAGAGLDSQGTGHSSNGTSHSGSHAEQSNGGIGRYSRADHSAPPLPLRDSIQGLLKPKQGGMQVS